MATLPYVTAPGNIDKALQGIISASTPESVSQDFVKTILKIPGGSGDQITSYLKKVGFAHEDGSPSELYVKFRNETTRGYAAKEGLRFGYEPLYIRNEYMHQLDDAGLRGLIIEETGHSKDSNVINLVVTAINTWKSFADFDSSDEEDIEFSSGQQNQDDVREKNKPFRKDLGMNLSYTINLNLPATSDVSVFNAIFKSLKENLLRDIDG